MLKQPFCFYSVYNTWKSVKGITTDVSYDISFGLTSLEQQKHWKNWFGCMQELFWVHKESLLQEGSSMHSQMQM